VKLSLAAIDLDSSIQCRAAIDMTVVGDYAERMEAGDTFPPIDVFGSKSKCWIGDGWHRVFAARQNGAGEIAATLNPGGRVDALKHALGANALHGHRRTNADKRRCVEIALREFPKLSSRALAKLCGVGHTIVDDVRPQALASDANATRTTSDGRQYPAHREPERLPVGVAAAPVESHPLPKLGPPRNGMDFARMALMDLEQIRDDDVERDAAFDCVMEWIRKRRG
jgi:hypothetical protein